MVQRVKGSARHGRGQASGLRALLLAYYRSRFGPGTRWHIRGKAADVIADLESGQAMLIDSSSVLCALMFANLPHDDYAYGGQHWGKTFHVSGDDVVTEWTAEDQDAYDGERTADAP